MKRRTFLQTGLGAAAMVAGLPRNANASEERTMNIVVAADPFAVDLKDAVKEHLEKRGFTVADVGAVKGRDMPYYDAAPLAEPAGCRAQHAQVEVVHGLLSLACIPLG